MQARVQAQPVWLHNRCPLSLTSAQQKPHCTWEKPPVQAEELPRQPALGGLLRTGFGVGGGPATSLGGAPRKASHRQSPSGHQGGLMGFRGVIWGQRDRARASLVISSCS